MGLFARDWLLDVAPMKIGVGNHARHALMAALSNQLHHLSPLAPWIEGA